jgi:sugar phosphate isomerase/epimerase
VRLNIMSHYSGNVEDFGMDTLSLAGSLEAKLKAVREAGFTQIMLAAKDLVSHPEGMDAAVAAVRTSGLRVTGFQVLRDFEGLSGQLHDYRIDIAKSMLEMCHALDCRLLLICSSTLKHATGETRALVRDLRQLAMLAIPMRIRIAYEAWPDGHVVKEIPQAWDLVCQADMPNLGLGFDSFHMFASGTSLDELDMLDLDKLFLVQLADFMGAEINLVEERMAPDRHFRVFPGEGVHSEALAGLVTRLHALGYRGDYSFAVFNDDYRQMPLPTVVQRAWRSALWLGEDVLRRSVPLPNQIRLKRSTAG